jgi:hypothetical protein
VWHRFVEGSFVLWSSSGFESAVRISQDLRLALIVSIGIMSILNYFVSVVPSTISIVVVVVIVSLKATLLWELQMFPILNLFDDTSQTVSHTFNRY